MFFSSIVVKHVLAILPIVSHHFQVVRKKTEKEKSNIINQATEISQNATAQTTVILAKAKALSLLKVEQARSSGLKMMFERLNITSEEHKASFNYLRTLRDHRKASLNINYKTLMAKGGA